MARSSTASRMRSCKPIWTNFTPISASEKEREETQGNDHEN
jgi:hypothetical protein